MDNFQILIFNCSFDFSNTFKHLFIYNTKQNDVCPSVSISVTTETIRFYSSGSIPAGTSAVLGYFIGGWDTPNHPKNKKSPYHFFCCQGIKTLVLHHHFFLITPWGKVPRGQGRSRQFNTILYFITTFFYSITALGTFKEF